MSSPIRYLKTLKSQLPNSTFYLFNSQIHCPSLQFVPNQADEFQFSEPQSDFRIKPKTSSVQISHPWPEWANLMEKLLRNGYFDEVGNPFTNGVLGNKEANIIRTACLNFARDQYQLIRCLSRKDILAIVEFGCSSTDRKVVNSGKRIRAHVGIDEGIVCSSCILRGDCDRAYIKAREDEGGRTVDVMRLLVQFGLDPIVGSVENKPCLNKRVKESVRMLLKEMVDNSVEGQDVEPPKDTTSKWIVSTEADDVTPDERNQTNGPMKRGDWICPKCDFLNFAQNVKCLRCNTFCEGMFIRFEEQEQEHLPLKKGDWICEKCNFLNFARNTRCLQCREKPTKRQINPGEWECESCSYINFRRNMVCLKCDHRRPIASKTQNIAPQPPNQNLKIRPVQHRFAREEQNGYEYYNDSSKFVKDESHACSGSSLSDGGSGFVDFPIYGGKSDLSSNIQLQEVWKMEMEKKSRMKAREMARDDSGSPGRIEFLASVDDNDDEMAEWFEGRKKT